MLSSHFPHTSCHPHALLLFLSLYPPSLSLFLSFVFSTDNRQSSHAVHLLRFWRRPSESPNTLSLFLSAQTSLTGIFPSFFSLHILPSCLLALSSPMNTTCSTAAGWFATPLPNLIALHPVVSLSVQCMSLTFVMT